MSPSVNPVTDSLNVMVTVMAALTGPVAALVIDTVGAAKFASTLNCGAAVLPLPAASSAASAPTSTVTVPLAVGVMVAL